LLLVDGKFLLYPFLCSRTSSEKVMRTKDKRKKKGERTETRGKKRGSESERGIGRQKQTERSREKEREEREREGEEKCTLITSRTGLLYAASVAVTRRQACAPWLTFSLSCTQASAIHFSCVCMCVLDLCVCVCVCVCACVSARCVDGNLGRKAQRGHLLDALCVHRLQRLGELREKSKGANQKERERVGEKREETSQTWTADIQKEIDREQTKPRKKHSHFILRVVEGKNVLLTAQDVQPLLVIEVHDLRKQGEQASVRGNAHRQTDQTEGQRDRQTERDRETDQTDRQTDRPDRPDRQTDRQTERQTDRQTDRQTRQTDRPDRQTDRQTHTHTHTHRVPSQRTWSRRLLRASGSASVVCTYTGRSRFGVSTCTSTKKLWKT
jgi:hypothetical protein